MSLLLDILPIAGLLFLLVNFVVERHRYRAKERELIAAAESFREEGVGEKDIKGKDPIAHE